MNDINIFDIQAAKEFARGHKKDNGLKIELIEDALNSIAKRNEYLNYFYSEFISITKESNLLIDRLGAFKVNDIALRAKYESISFAFLSNLHEMLDSYAFIYLGIYSDKNPIDDKFGWGNLTVTEEVLRNKTNSLKGNHNFKLLKDLNNYRKHGALPKIKNCGRHLEININFAGGENYKNLNELLIELHDKLIPQYFEILHLTFKEA